MGGHAGYCNLPQSYPEAPVCCLRKLCSEVRHIMKTRLFVRKLSPRIQAVYGLRYFDGCNGPIRISKFIYSLNSRASVNYVLMKDIYYTCQLLKIVMGETAHKPIFRVHFSPNEARNGMIWYYEIFIIFFSKQLFDLLFQQWYWGKRLLSVRSSDDSSCKTTNWIGPIQI